MRTEQPGDQETEALNGKVAVITGGTSGIGAHIGELFAAHGATVVIAGRRRPQGTQLASKIGASATFRQTDVSIEQDVQDLFCYVDNNFGKLDCLVNSAGDIGSPNGVTTLEMGNFWRTMNLHVGGVVCGMKYAAPLMKRQRSGSIINIASIAGRFAGWTGLDYSTAKAAVIQATRCAAIELAEDRVRVNSISPGPILTGIFGKGAGVNHAEADRDAEVLERVFDSRLETWQPIPRAGQTADVAPTAVWLASDASVFLTGQNIVVDGGISAGRPAAISVADNIAIAEAISRSGAPRGARKPARSDGAAVSADDLPDGG